MNPCSAHSSTRRLHLVLPNLPHRDTLVTAPTSSGKTLTAFLAALDDLVVRGLAPGGLPDETAVVYVSPLKALSNDIRLNLDAPLAGIRAELAALGLPMSTCGRRCTRATRSGSGSGSRPCAGH